MAITPTQAHFDASQGFENQAAAGDITGSQADFLKGQNLIETGFNPILAAAGAYPYQVGQEVFRDVRDQGISGIGSGLARGTQAGWDNLRGIGSALEGNKWADWGGPFGAPSTNDLINFGSLLKDNLGTIKSEGPGVIKSYAEDLNPMNYIDMTPLKQLLPDRFNPNIPEEPEWDPEGLQFDLEMQGLPEGKSWFQRAMERLIPAASAETFLPSGGYEAPRGIPGIEMDPTLPIYPPVPIPAQPQYPTLTPDPTISQQRIPHFTAPQDDFSGVQWTVPDIVKPPSEFDISTEDFRAPPVPSAPSDIHPRSGVPPRTPQVAGGTESKRDKARREKTEAKRAETIKRSVERAIVPTRVIRANERRAASATQKALTAFAKHEEAKRSGSPAEIARTQHARAQAAIERKEADARNRSTQRYDPFAFEDRRGGRR